MNIWPQINNEVDSQKNENDVFGRGIMAKMDTGFSLRALELEDNSVIFLLRNLIYNVFFLNKYVTITIFTFNVADISGDLFLCSNHFFFSVTGLASTLVLLVMICLIRPLNELQMVSPIGQGMPEEIGGQAVVSWFAL